MEPLDRKRLRVAVLSTVVAVPLLVIDLMNQGAVAEGPADDRVVTIEASGALGGGWAIGPFASAIEVDRSEGVWQQVSSAVTGQSLAVQAEALRGHAAARLQQAQAAAAAQAQADAAAAQAAAAQADAEAAAAEAEAEAEAEAADEAEAAASVRERPPTTTAAPPSTTQPPPPPAPARSQSGQATYYDWRAGNCAHRTLPMGTVVTVTNTATGATATCTVGDRGPFSSPSRIIDLDLTVFSQIAAPSKGVVDVVISW